MSPPTTLFEDHALPAALQVRSLHLQRGDETLGPFTPPVRIGSARGNEVVIDDAAVSCFHAVIERTPEGLCLRDVGSRNGTFVGGVRVRDAFLAEGATVQVGQTTLVVRVAGARPMEMSLTGRFGALWGESVPMRALFSVLERLAAVDVTVLVEGETGVGKELVARGLHEQGARAGGPFVVVDCGAIAPTLVESELFGHARGAFTGAHADHQGAFAAASGGTLFLDEIGELPLALQPKLLRALETGAVRRLGETAERAVDVRVVAATHRDLRAMVNAGTFREDLYYRLAVCPVAVPPLRERGDDVLLLARRFLCDLMDLESASLSAETARALRGQAWPGNVRELRDVIERAVVLGDPAALRRGDLADALRRSSRRAPAADDFGGPMEDARARFERGYLLRLLARHGRDRVAAAAEADIHPKSLARLIRRHDLPR